MQHFFISVSSMRPAESFSLNLWSSETFSFSIWPVYSFEFKTAGLKQMDKIHFLFRPSSLASFEQKMTSNFFILLLLSSCLLHKVSISSTFHTQMFHTEVCSNSNSKQRKAAQKTFVQKNCVYNVDEIDTRSLFHQHFMSSFYVCRSQKCYKNWRLDCIFCLLGIWVHKSYL